MADTAHITLANRAIDRSEIDDLFALARRLAEHDELVEHSIGRLIRQFDFRLASDPHPLDAERLAERFSHDLRQLWLDAAAHEASSVYRSPTEGEARRIARNHDAFGYERDLQPETLEQRCADFFPPPPPGWSADHVFFSSGQAAMTAALIGLASRLSPSGEWLSLSHLGGYFETRALVDALPALIRRVPASFADLLLVDTLNNNGEASDANICAVAQRLAHEGARPRAIIFDTTMLGRDDGLDRCLAVLAPLKPQAVLRVTSCLKLFQAGFELSNAGIVSAYTLGPANSFGADLRRIRTFTGAGLHLVDAIALEAPWFLDADHADAYVSAVFDHNARLAEAVAATNTRFASVSPAGAAPYCVFRLPDASADNYQAFDAEIAKEASRRDLLLARGGSFGFRGHRYEIVKPETGEPPFLRIAMGRRGGWSCEGVVEMMSEIAAAR